MSELGAGHVREMPLESDLGAGYDWLNWEKTERTDMSGMGAGYVWSGGWTCPPRISGIRLGGWTSSWTDFSTLLEFGFLTSLMESLLLLSTLVLSRSPCCIPLYTMMTYTQERNKAYKNKLELVNLILLCAIFIFV
jgi:hypothetical protein